MANTLGERRIRKTPKKFNSDEQAFVDEIKQRGIDLINLIDSAAHNPASSDEEMKDFFRWKAMAIADVESAATNATKMVCA